MNDFNKGDIVKAYHGVFEITGKIISINNNCLFIDITKWMVENECSIESAVNYFNNKGMYFHIKQCEKINIKKSIKEKLYGFVRFNNKA